jgi:serine/threonine-protein kinase
VHRDVGPNNILLGRAGDVKLTDFGIVRSALFDTRTAPGEVKGKIGYVSPEQAIGAPLDARSDLFSLGVVLAEMIICEPLFPGNTDLEILTSLHRGDLGRLEAAGAKIPEALMPTLRRALAHKPAERFASAREFADALESAARTLGLTLGTHEFSEWLRDLGVLAIPSNVSEITRQQQASKGEPIFTPIKLVASALDPDEATVRHGRSKGLGLSRNSDTPSELRSSSSPAPASSKKVPSPPPAPEYCVRRPGGTIVGPIGVSRIMEMIATARAGADTEVAPVGGTFHPIQALTQFSRLAARPAYKFFEPVALMATERHPIEAASFAWHLFRLVAGRKTGLLCARFGREQKRIYFVEGAPAVSASTDPNELLGACLMMDQKLDSLALERALGISFRDQQPVGQVLVGAGVLRPSELVKAVSAQRLRRLTSLLAWREGELFFLPGATSGEDAFALPSAPTKLIASAVRSAYDGEELQELLQRIENEALEPRPAYQQQRLALELEPEENRILEKAVLGMKVKNVLADAKSRGGAVTVSAARALFLGLSSGAVGLRSAK